MQVTRSENVRKGFERSQYFSISRPANADAFLVDI
jgi:hypothetical protein